MKENKNLYEKIDDMQEKVDKIDDMNVQMQEIRKAVDDIAQKQNNANTITNTQTQTSKTSGVANILQQFLLRSKAEYLWYNIDNKTFSYRKKQIYLWILALFILGITLSILATINFSIYSTFTLFENLWLLMMLFVLKHTICSKQIMHHEKIAKNSCYRYKFDASCTYLRENVKGSYKVLFVLSIISAFANILVCFVQSKSLALGITVGLLELLWIAGTFYVWQFVIKDFFNYDYPFIKFTDVSLGNTSKYIIFDTIRNKFLNNTETSLLMQNIEETQS